MEIDIVNNQIKEILIRHMHFAGCFPTAIPEVFMARADYVGTMDHRFDHPMVMLLVQGKKKTTIGTRENIIQRNQVLTVALDMPSSSIMLDATPDNPLLAIYFYINKSTIADLLVELDWSGSSLPSSPGFSIANADADFQDGIYRLISLIEKPEQIPVRSKMIMCELHYLLLIGQQKNILRGIFGTGTFGDKISSAITYLKSHINQAISSKELAKAANLCESSLYRHFKTLTGLSPMQYHKQLRLHEARRLIFTENEHASQAAMRVGYESITQFNREYKRLFGLPPLQSKKINQ